MDFQTRKIVWRAQFNQWMSRYGLSKDKFSLKHLMLKWLVRAIKKLEPDLFKLIRKQSFEQGKKQAEADHENRRNQKQAAMAVQRKRFRNKKGLRQIVLKDAGYTCHYCGKFDGDLTIDHLIPLSRGGTNERSNLVAACSACNSEKGQLKHTEVL